MIKYDINYILSLKSLNTINPFFCEIKIIRNPNNFKYRKNQKRGPFRNENKLVRGDNAWKSSNDLDEDEQTMKKIKSILNKLTNENFNVLVENLMSFKLNENLIKKVVNEIFQKAIMEPFFSKLYSKLCCCFGNFNISFKNQILLRSTTELSNSTNDDIYEENRTKIIKIRSSDDISTSEQNMLVAEEEYKMKMKKILLLGNVTFVGDLYNINMLNEDVIHNYIQMFFNNICDDNIECMCKMFQISGYKLRNISTYMEKMEILSNDKNIKPRMRFMMKDILDLKKNNWKSKKK